MLIRDVMSRSVATLHPDSTVQEAAEQMRSLDVGALPVFDGDRLIGILTDRDIVGVITRDPKHAREIAAETGASTLAGAATGVGLGAIFGGATGWLVGLGALTIPAIGPVVAAGPLAFALGVAGASAAVGAGAGAIAGGLVGALMGWGFSEAEAHEYQRRVEGGDILLTADVNDEAVQRADEILRRDDDHINTRRAA